MNNLPTIFTGTAPTKTEIVEQSQNIIDSIIDSGDVNPLKVATSMKALELAIKTIRGGIDDFMIEEASKYESKSFDYDGHAISVRELGTKYDYSLCCDPVLARIESKVKFANDELKERQTFLKTVKDEMTIVDDESGEVFTVLPPTKSSKTGITITLKK